MRWYNAACGLGLTILVGAGIPYFSHGRKSVVYRQDPLWAQTYPLREKRTVVKELVRETQDACARQSLQGLEKTLDNEYAKVQPQLIDLNNRMIDEQEKMMHAGLIMIGGTVLLGIGTVTKLQNR